MKRSNTTMKQAILTTSICTLIILSQTFAFAQKQCGIIAHRGFWNCQKAGYTENSIAALRCAQEQGFWGSEFDVNMTADSILLVYHNKKINGKKIENHPYSEFADIRLKNGEKIPTIDQYLEQGRKYPETMLVYELKPLSSDKAENLFIDITIQKLKEHDLLDPTRVMFISFSMHICEVLAQKLPEFTIQYLNGDKSPKAIAKKGINGIDYRYTVFYTHKKWIEQAKNRDMSTNSWTVNKDKDILNMLNLKVDMITTDDPIKTRGIMKELLIQEL